MDAPERATEMSSINRLNLKAKEQQQQQSPGYHSTKCSKLAYAFEQNFAFTTLSFWKEWINTLLPHSSIAKMRLSMYEAFGLKF